MPGRLPGGLEVCLDGREELLIAEEARGSRDPVEAISHREETPDQDITVLHAVGAVGLEERVAAEARHVSKPGSFTGLHLADLEDAGERVEECRKSLLEVASAALPPGIQHPLDRGSKEGRAVSLQDEPLQVPPRGHEDLAGRAFRCLLAEEILGTGEQLCTRGLTGSHLPGKELEGLLDHFTLDGHPRILGKHRIGARCPTMPESIGTGDVEFHGGPRMGKRALGPRGPHPDPHEPSHQTRAMIALIQEQASGFAGTLKELPWVDQVGLVLVTLFALLGVWRGLWWQVIRLAGVVLAVGLARGLTPRFKGAVAEALGIGPDLSSGIVWLVLFVTGIVAATLLGMIGKRALEGMQLGLVDRFGGLLAGGLTGLMLHAAVLVVISSLGSDRGWGARSLEGSRSGYLLTQLTRRPILMDAQAAESIVRPWAESWNEPSQASD